MRLIITMIALLVAIRLLSRLFRSLDPQYYFHSAPYALLHELIEEGLVETRLRTSISQAELDIRDGDYPSEYRLATGGIRRKNELESGAEHPLSIFRPQESK